MRSVRRDFANWPIESLRIGRIARRTESAKIGMGLLAALMVCVIVTFLGAMSAGQAFAQTAPDPRARCAQLIAYYDRYGASRSGNSDGERNMIRIGAEIDCDRGCYAEGIKAMEDLLVRKKFTVPPAQ